MTEGNLDIFLCPLNAYGGCFWEYLENDKYEKKMYDCTQHVGTI